MILSDVEAAPRARMHAICDEAEGVRTICFKTTITTESDDGHDLLEDARR
jgi:hypothetical protein